MKASFILLLVALTGCGATCDKGSFPLVNGYAFFNDGGIGKWIAFEGKNAEVGAFIEPTVVAYKVNGSHIAALQQPAKLVAEKQTTRWQLEEKCHYWLLNTEDHNLSGPFDRATFLEVAAPFGFDATSLAVPATNKVSRYCFDDLTS